MDKQALLEQVYEESFNDEFEKIGWGFPKTTPDTMSSAQRMQKARSYSSAYSGKNNLGAAAYNLAAAGSRQRMSPADSTRFVKKFNTTTGKTLEKLR